MIQKLKTEWYHFKISRTGQRFKERHRRLQREKFVDRITQSALGIVLSLLGLVLIPLPGPGTIVAAFGLCLIGSEFGPVARLLDKIEARLSPKFRPFKQRFDKFSTPVKIAIELSLVVVTGGISYALSRFFA